MIVTRDWRLVERAVSALDACGKEDSGEGTRHIRSRKLPEGAPGLIIKCRSFKAATHAGSVSDSLPRVSGKYFLLVSIYPISNRSG